MWPLLLLLSLSSELTNGLVENTPRSILCRACNQDEVISEVVPCCEPTCENDCSLANCPKQVIHMQTCICRPDYVRHLGSCIPRSACPPIEQHISSCSIHEELLPTPPCCEATCSNNCTDIICRTTLIHRPTCVCERGYVRNEGRCITPDHCPTCGPYARYSHCTPCCESTCTMDCSQILCLTPCSGKPRCLCQPGYVKHNGACIRKEMCPRDSNSIESREHLTEKIVESPYHPGEDIPYYYFSNPNQEF
ncbi:keratin-associated protein 9-1-like [Malaya genurostris]|uniref:keratin-associated protein 9-1-like n=1 Tax=Malaya genurostris TaxID=325434 RepID=UPI0026F3F836|nr:keratin-associated protein 9-1-like [Malaya genurostris]